MREERTWLALWIVDVHKGIVVAFLGPRPLSLARDLGAPGSSTERTHELGHAVVILQARVDVQLADVQLAGCFPVSFRNRRTRYQQP